MSRIDTPAGTKLSSKTVQLLRGLGHSLNAVVQIGKEGLSTAVVTQTKGALATHELIKVKLGSESPLDRHETAEALALAADAALVQVIGRTFLLFRASPKKKVGKIDLATGKRSDKKPDAKKRPGLNRLGVKQRAKAKAARQPRREETQGARGGRGARSWGARDLPRQGRDESGGEGHKSEKKSPPRGPQGVKKPWKDR